MKASLRTLSFLTLVSAMLFCPALMAQVAPATPAVRIVDRIDERQLVKFHGTVHPLANAANDRGAAPESMPLERMHLVLKRSSSQETSLRQFVGDLHRAGSPSYHKWLTPEEFGKQFGPSDQDIATVEAWLSGHGFNQLKVNPGRQTIEITGNVAQLRSAFHTQVHKYQVNGQTRFANASDPQIPAALAPVVGGFVALNNFPIKSNVRVRGKAGFDPKTHEIKPQWTWGTSQGFNLVLSPADYAVQYDIAPLYSAGINGSGQSIAIINPSNINVAVVNQFRSMFGLPVNPPQVIVDGNDPGVNGNNNPYGPNGWAVESYLDVEWAGAVAPNATIYLVTAGDTALEDGIFLAAERAVYSNIAPVISASVAECEPFMGSGNEFINDLWLQAAAQGITVMVSASDDGSAGCDNWDSQYYAVFGQAVNGFSSTPYNVSVGGTDFYYDDYASGAPSLSDYWNMNPTQAPAVSLRSVVPEQPWNDGPYGLNAWDLYANDGYTSIAAGSGGASSNADCYQTSGGGTCTGYPKPAWQSGNGVPADGVRDIPDVSLFAADGMNYSFYPICADDGDCQTPTGNNIYQIFGVDGTSASSPAFAGMMALVNQKYGRQGQANYVLYPMKAQFPAAFHDITAGNNSVPCNMTTVYDSGGWDYPPTDCIQVSSPLYVTDPTFGETAEGQMGNTDTNAVDYNATAGYNLATGLGTIDLNQMVKNWGNVTGASGSSTTLTPSQTSFAHGTAITISGTVTGSGTPMGWVSFLNDSIEPNMQGEYSYSLRNGSFSGQARMLPGGTYNIWGQYGGDAQNGLSTSPKTQVTVSPEASGVFLNVFSPTGGLSSVDPGITLPYGTVLSLSAIPTPSSDLAAYENCFNEGGTCPFFGNATGTVTFKDGATALSTVLLNAEGDAEYTPPAGFSAGSHSITANYSGDNSYNPSTAAAISFTISKVTPGVYGLTPQYPIPQGQAGVITVMVEGQGGAAPAGSVTLTGTPAGTPASGTLSAGQDPASGVNAALATFLVPATAAAGTYNINAVYTPSGSSAANYNASSSSLTLRIGKISGRVSTTTTASASMTATSPTVAITISGTVKAASGSAPTGYVEFYIPYSIQDQAGYIIWTRAYLSQGSGTSSTFSLTMTSTSLMLGTNQLTVMYQPEAGSLFLSSSTAVTISNPLSDFALVAQTTNVAVTAGTPATDNILLSSVHGFSGAVSLACSAATGVTCQIPASATLASNGGATAALTLSAPISIANGNYNVLVTGTDSTRKYVHTLGIQVVVSGAGQVPGASLLPASLSFPSTPVNSAAATQGITLSNPGTGPLTLSGGVSITGSGASSFSQTNNCGASVAIKGSCTIVVTFKPKAAGTSSAYVSVADNATGSPQTAPISGIGTVAPVVTLSTTGLTFASTAVGTAAATQKITVTNSGTAALTWTSPVALSGDSSFTQTNTCTTSLAVNGTCAITVTFKPAAIGALQGTVTIADNAANSPQSVSLSGTGSSAVASLSTSNLSFGNVAVGSTSALPMTLTNQGNAALTLSSTAITVSGTNASAFTQTNKCGTSLAAKGSCTITVTFKPGAGGSLAGKLSIADNAAGSPQTVTLGGTGIAPAVNLSATSLTFPGTLVKTPAATQSVTLNNTGKATLMLGSGNTPGISITGTGAASFAQSNNCGASVAASGSCSITVTFTPAATGSLAAEVSIADNATGSTQSVGLAGTGTAPAVSLAPATLTFTGTLVGTAAKTQAITLSNTGTAALTLGSGNTPGVSITGTGASSYLQTNTCGASVAAGSKCTITVTFAPAASGSLMAKVSVADNATGSPQSISLTGTGTAPVVKLTPTSLNFGSTTVGVSAATKTITLSNTGTAALTMGAGSTPAISITGNNASSFTQTNKCGASVAAGGNCVITVTFKPTATENLAAVLSITDSASDSAQTAALMGIGK